MELRVVAIACFWDLHICQENFPVWVVCPRAGVHCLYFWHLPVGGPACLPHGDKPDTVHPARASQVQERPLRPDRPTLDLCLRLRAGDHPVVLPHRTQMFRVFCKSGEPLQGRPCFLRTKSAIKPVLDLLSQPRTCSTVCPPRGLKSPEEQRPSTLSLLTSCSQEPYPCSSVSPGTGLGGK